MRRSFLLKKVIISIGISLSLLFLGENGFAVNIKSQQINFWHKEIGLQSEELDKIIEEFGRRYRVNIVSEGFRDLAFSLIKAKEANTLPHVILAPGDLVGLANILNYSNVPEGIGKRCAIRNINRLLTVDGKLIGVPVMGGNHLMMFYNKKYIKTPPKNWAEIIRLKKELHALGVNVIGWNYAQPYYLMPFLKPFGGYLFKRGSVQMENEGFREALVFYKSLSDMGLIPGDCDESCGGQRFFNGEFALAINGDWALEEAERALGSDFGIALLPKIKGKKMYPLMTGTSLFFPGKSLDSSISKQLKLLIDYLQSDAIQRRLAKVYRVPVGYAALKEQRMSTQFGPALYDQMYQTVPVNEPHKMMYLWHILHKGMRVYFKQAVNLERVTVSMQKMAEEALKTEKRNQNFR